MSEEIEEVEEKVKILTEDEVGQLTELANAINRGCQFHRKGRGSSFKFKVCSGTVYATCAFGAAVEGLYGKLENLKQVEELEKTVKGRAIFDRFPVIGKPISKRLKGAEGSTISSQIINLNDTKKVSRESIAFRVMEFVKQNG